jgi:lycopene cyclase domain-containing protein
MAGHGTYAVIDLAFLAVAVAVAIVASVVAARRSARRHGSAGVPRWRRTTIVTGLIVGVVLVVMTVVFDNVIVGLRIVAYDPARLSGAHIGFVPIEDLAYAVAAVLLLPSLAVLFGPRQQRTAPGAQTNASSRGREGAL